MKFKEFELEIQSLMDQRKFEQAESLLTSVDREDLDRCTQLVQVYEAMYGGLSSTEEPVLAMDAEEFSEGILSQLQGASEQETNQSGANWSQRISWFGLATAASLLLIALPFSLAEWKFGNSVVQPEPTEKVSAPNSRLAGSRQTPNSLPNELDNSQALDWNSLATRIGNSEGATNLTYTHAEPWIEGVSSRLRPLTYSMGTAFTLIRKTTDLPSDDSKPSDTKPQVFWRIVVLETLTA
ncbi:MAG: hypothetical protein ACKVH8_19015 [Pirellulales bacterium]